MLITLFFNISSTFGNKSPNFWGLESLSAPKGIAKGHVPRDSSCWGWAKRRTWRKESSDGHVLKKRPTTFAKGGNPGRKLNFWLNVHQLENCVLCTCSHFVSEKTGPFKWQQVSTRNAATWEAFGDLADRVMGDPSWSHEDRYYISRWVLKSRVEQNRNTCRTEHQPEASSCWKILGNLWLYIKAMAKSLSCWLTILLTNVYRNDDQTPGSHPQGVVTVALSSSQRRKRRLLG